MNNRAEEVEIYTWWRIKTKRCNEEAGWTWGDTQSERERGHLPASANTVILHLNTHCVTWQTTSERGEWGGEGGRRAGRRHCTESTSTTMDGHTPNTHTHAHTLLHRVPVCVPLHSPGCQNLAVSCQGKEKQQTNRLTNKRTKRRTTHTLDSTGYNKKINQKRNLGYKKSQWHRVLQKAFSQ